MLNEHNESGENKLSIEQNKREIPPKLTMKQIEARALDPVKKSEVISALLDNTKWDRLDYVNPEQIVLEAATHIDTAMRLREGLARLGMGTNKVRKRYLLCCYNLSLSIKDNMLEIEKLRDLLDYHTSFKIPKLEIFANEYLDWLIKFVFVSSGYGTINTATRYYNALEYHLQIGASVERVKDLLSKFGPEKMYRHSVRRRAFLAAQSAWQSGLESPFAELDDQAPDVGDGDGIDEGDGDRADGHDHVRQHALNDEELDLPSADLDDPAIADDGQDEQDDRDSDDSEEFDVSEAIDIVNASSEIAHRVRDMLHNSTGIENKTLRALSFQLTLKLTQLHSLMVYKQRSVE